MQVETRLKSLSPQGRLSVYHNRTVSALWLMVLIGVLTIAEPFILFGTKVIFSPGLIAPEVIASLTKQSFGSAPHKLLAVVLGLFIIILGVMGMAGKVAAFITGAVLLALDLLFLFIGIFVSKPDSEEVFMVAIILAVRVFSLGITARGIRAVGQKHQLREEMGDADRKYEEEKKQGIRYCANCGAPLVEGNRFCEQCGSEMEV